jgi:drug/metabolite transporter (DMT)-like permease
VSTPDPAARREGSFRAGHAARTTLLTATALLAFAANSLLCRLALGERAIDAASFTTLRLVAGAAALWLARLPARKPGAANSGGTWLSGLLLFLYAVAFSFAYLSLGVGTGALILFAAVQATMILAGLRAGERPHAREWTGLALALGGLVYLVSPGLTAPSPAGSALMAVAGVAWGAYSLHGRGSTNPVTVTGGNFLRAVPPALIVSLAFLPSRSLSVRGIALAVLSGAIASGLGYVVWYAALRGLTATRAAIVQLLVPVVAAGAGVVFLSESVTVRLALSAAVILTGVALAVAGREVAPFDRAR